MITYTIQEGDTLSSIADRFLGDWSLYASIYGQNFDVIQAEQERYSCRKDMRGPDWIFPGTVLTFIGSRGESPIFPGILA